MAGLVALVFLAVPFPVEEKTHSVLHGLCAQRPSHSFWMGEHRLPFDARMTGIYGGFAFAFAFLACRGRLWTIAFPSLPVIGTLTVFLLAMAVDGANSLLLDLGRWHPYAPRNEIRLVTGLLTGIALAAGVCFLLSSTLWQRVRRDRAIVGGMQELGLMVALQAPFAALVLSGISWLYVPIAAGLVLAATAVVTALMLVMTTIAVRRDGCYSSIGQLSAPATLALLLALVVMGAIAGGRFWLEQTLGAPPLM